jgi:hypothetical protein
LSILSSSLSAAGSSNSNGKANIGQSTFYSRIGRFMTNRCTTAVLLFALGVLGCSPHDGFDRGVYSSNHEEIRDLQTLLGAHGIPCRHTDPDKGMDGLLFRSHDESRVALLRQKLDRQVSVKFKSPEAQAYLQKVLTEMNHDFILSQRSDGTWIKWFPESGRQRDDVDMQVVQHQIALEAKRAAQDCKPSSKPSSPPSVSGARTNESRAKQCGR